MLVLSSDAASSLMRAVWTRCNSAKNPVEHASLLDRRLMRV